MNFSPLKEITQSDVSSYKLLLTKMYEELVDLQAKLPEYLSQHDEKSVSEVHHRVQTTFKMLELADLNQNIYELRSSMVEGNNPTALKNRIVTSLQNSSEKILEELNRIK